MVFVRAFIVSFVVLGALGLLAKKNDKKAGRRSQRKFVIKAPVSFIPLGTVGMALVGGILIWGYIERDISFGGEGILFIVVGIPSLMLMAAPIKGLWDIRIEDDDITIVKLFIFRKHFNFHELEYMRITRGGHRVYTKGRKRMAFFVDGMCNNVDLFMKRTDKC